MHRSNEEKREVHKEEQHVTMQEMHFVESTIPCDGLKCEEVARCGGASMYRMLVYVGGAGVGSLRFIKVYNVS
jgi:hypothetical protein